MGLSLFARAERHGGRVAIMDAAGDHSYHELLEASARIASRLLQSRADLDELRVAFLVPPSFEHVAVQWGVWRAGGIAVPLALSHPDAEFAYVIRDSGAGIVVADPASADRLRPLGEAEHARFFTTTETLAAGMGSLPEMDPARRAMIVYTSGTTGKPKGVVSTHRNIEAQIRSLVEAWEWTPADRVLLVLPLHHVHGIINVVSCALWTGATCEMLPRFDAAQTWQRIMAGRLTVFMAVPTIYQRLIAAWQRADLPERARMSAGCRRMRLMVSGSAALPVSVLEEWREISGHTLLERYGMTEFGMAISNPLHGERRPGFVGEPLPGVQVRLMDETGEPSPDGTPGEIQVLGPNVFPEYWNRPGETREAFRDGWFRTGDTAVRENGFFRILGRSSVDILKTGGFKVSALEIEEQLRAHPAIRECAVVGLPDPEWGERIAAAVELREGATLDLEELREWARPHLAPYKLPRVLRCIPTLPRNAMGKVVKPEVAKLF
jgi:malonyl-CoA/methylmalonyl-CoA synthetase